MFSPIRLSTFNIHNLTRGLIHLMIEVSDWRSLFLYLVSKGMNFSLRINWFCLKGKVDEVVMFVCIAYDNYRCLLNQNLCSMHYWLSWLCFFLKVKVSLRDPFGLLIDGKRVRLRRVLYISTLDVFFVDISGDVLVGCPPLWLSDLDQGYF